MALLTSPIAAQTPMSAIDWLSDSVATPVAMPPETAPAPQDNTDVTKSAAVDEITVTTLGGPEIDAVGLLPVSVTGLPRDLWGSSNSADLVRLLRAEPAQAMPAMQSLQYLLLLAELDPPFDADGRGRLFLARIDRLLDLGALEQAQALLERASSDTPELFRRTFDVGLLTGTEDRACATLRDHADIAPTYAARIFCLARNGDWDAAALTLGTAEALGFISEEEDALLARFLDPELFEGEPPLPLPSRVTPLVFRMREAIGEPIPTAPLPLAFAQADLRTNAGWKSQIEAAERLARTGAIGETRLLGIYTANKPAASGGVWDRVKALQEFDAAIQAHDTEAVATTLPRVWTAMRQAQLEVPFARLYAESLARLALSGTADKLAFRIAMLSPAYEEIAGKHPASDGHDRFLISLAQGEMEDAVAKTALQRAVRDGFLKKEPPAGFAALLRDGRLGEALLKVPPLLQTGAAGDLQDLSDALALLRQVGLEDIARQTAFQVLLLNRHG